MPLCDISSTSYVWRLEVWIVQLTTYSERRTCSSADRSLVSTPYLHLSALRGWRGWVVDDVDDDDGDSDRWTPMVMRDIAAAGSSCCRLGNESTSSSPSASAAVALASVVVVVVVLLAVGLTLSEFGDNRVVAVLVAEAGVDSAAYRYCCLSDHTTVTSSVFHRSLRERGTVMFWEELTIIVSFSQNSTMPRSRNCY